MCSNQFSNLVDDMTQYMVEIKKVIDANFSAEESQAFYSEMAPAAKGIIESDFRLKNEETALNTIRQQIGDKPKEDIEKDYIKALKTEEEKNDYKSHDLWSRVFGDGSREVEEIETETAQNVEFEQLNASIACSVPVFTPPIDPITKSVIKDPYRNRKCNHVFENRIIFEYMQKKKNARCPFVGCMNKLKPQDILPDEDLKRQIEEYFQIQENLETDIETGNQTESD